MQPNTVASTCIKQNWQTLKERFVYSDFSQNLEIKLLEEKEEEALRSDQYSE